MFGRRVPSGLHDEEGAHDRAPARLDGAGRIRERHADQRASVLRREPTIPLGAEGVEADEADEAVARAAIATVFRERGLHVAERIRHAETKGVSGPE